MSSIPATITRVITPDLKEFESRLREDIRSNAALLDTIMQFIVRRKGKLLRPMFVFLSARLFGNVNDSSYRAASLVEILHTATLIHDDVVDESLERRGFFSVNALWKNKVAVLVGDYLLSRGLLLALDHGDHDMLAYLSRAVKAMSEGELMQLEKSRKLNITEDTYFEIIKNKTASLIAAACATGARSTTNDKATIEKIRTIGEHAGIAFQIKDDLLDFGTDDIGKPLGKDIRDKKMTLPVILVLQSCDPITRNNMLQTIRNDHDKPLRMEKLIDFIRERGGFTQAQTQMQWYADQAIGGLKEFPDSEVRTAFIDLIQYTIRRNY